ncbi:hypothetical protein JTB14_024107 [Gonioctena quinquepunctata]|nr:hypothetical protein JTB14_024107 [Gonioctena quinquepunctata]
MKKELSSSSSESSRELQLESEEELYYKNDERPNPISDPSSLSVGDHVIVSYEEDYFPGVIKELKKSNAFVSVIQKSLANTWKSPQRQYSLWYDFKDIMEKIEEPAKANENLLRHFVYQNFLNIQITFEL